ncbi:threonine aldolase family protein [Propionicimonas sp.]|uniref:threonine aldolase family protein n=1 Tax=Propionicimonas sp. TaxID=1955623 RepID=UPI0017CB2619|nr:threonine aldolase family protein [Propionicimonas sp.]MBU3976510.1 threonine aldolase family protein [Actinomycetota bacterium]MBA3020490.1 low specificity L-threonine aldolase [Propionicimonas sp.]MBU3986663.1 threonine aldolase family protein [Actinomycetota bacterium]MBU4007185.1 threonine aldolase family protein [Actinomycetota bacterium]MBU4064938.1 threonine aldolase family protein [Actinomycetota bacterium]
MKFPALAEVTIDLRSDTLSRPTAGMRAAMAAAEVGDDVYGEDPTINALQERVAELLGHEAGLFTPTGSMGNLLGIWALAKPGQEVLCDARAHLVRAELGAHAALHGITTRTWTSANGVTDTATIAELIAPPTAYLVQTAAVALENTHNFGGGTIQPLAHLQEVSALCRDAEVGLHLDGARLWNAHVATGVPLADYGRLFDTVNVCFSKGLGAPVGSMLVSSRANIEAARVQRKRLGGGMRQAGILAAAAAYALDNQLERLAEDHASAAAFAAAVAAEAPEAVTAPQTNIVMLNTGSSPAAEVVAAAAKLGVRISAVGPRTVRAVTCLEVSHDQAALAGQLVGRLLAH